MLAGQCGARCVAVGPPPAVSRLFAPCWPGVSARTTRAKPVNLSVLATLALRQVKDLPAKALKFESIHVLDECGGDPCCEKSKMTF